MLRVLVKLGIRDISKVSKAVASRVEARRVSFLLQGEIRRAMALEDITSLHAPRLRRCRLTGGWHSDMLWNVCIALSAHQACLVRN